jgi:hypothetical protein
MNSAEEFAARHGLEATQQDVARIRRQLARFFADVEAMEQPGDWYIQLYRGEAVRAAFTRALKSSLAIDAAIAMAEMPGHWPTTYRASVAYHLAPLLDDVVNS